MTAANFPECLEHVLKHEGGYVNDPRDPGGETNKGVTKAVYDAYRRRRRAPRRSVRHITNVELLDIYKAQYWDRVQGDHLPSGLDYAVFDFAVNSGTNRAEKEIQRVVDVKDDGQIGLQTLDAINGFPTCDAVNQLCDRRLAFMKRIRHRKTGMRLWTTFGRGWQRRVDGVRKTANEMVHEAAGPPPPEIPAPDPAPEETPPTGFAALLANILKSIFGRK